MSDSELILSDYDEDGFEFDSEDPDQEEEEDQEMLLSSPIDSDSDTAGGGGGGPSGLGGTGGRSPFSSSTPISNSYNNNHHQGGSSFSSRKGKGRASLGGLGSDDKLYGQVDWQVYSLKELEEEQKVGTAYVEDMLKLKVTLFSLLYSTLLASSHTNDRDIW